MYYTVLYFDYPYLNSLLIPPELRERPQLQQIFVDLRGRELELVRDCDQQWLRGAARELREW